MSERDAAADLATCDDATPGPWISSSVAIREEILPGEGGHLIASCNQYTLEKSRANAKFIAASREALPYWLREVERLRGVEEANLAMSADLIAMEGTIKDLRHELDRSRNAHGKAELENARLRRDIIQCQFCRVTWPLGTPDDDLTQHAMTCEKSPVVQELARLELIAQGAADECDKCGWNMKFPGEPCRCELVKEVSRHSTEANAPAHLRAWRDAAPGRWYSLENDIGRSEVLVLGQTSEEPHCPSKEVVVSSDDGPRISDQPATFAEMVEAALSRWAELYGEGKP